MAALNAVISFNCPAGPEELIDDGINGFLVDLNDIETFKNRLQLLMDNESICHKFSVMAKKKIEEFSIEVIGKRYINTLLNENEQIY